METTKIIAGSVFVIAVTIICSTQGIPRPQEQTNDFVAVDGFVFDGPIERTNPSSSSELPPTLAPTSLTPTFIPTLPSVQPPSSAPPTGTQAPVTQSPQVAQCIQNCRFRVTSEYNPVCGTDRSVYGNPGLLRCAKVCGHDVDEAYLGPCTTNIRG